MGDIQINSLLWSICNHFSVQKKILMTSVFLPKVHFSQYLNTPPAQMLFRSNTCNNPRKFLLVYSLLTKKASQMKLISLKFFKQHASSAGLKSHANYGKRAFFYLSGQVKIYGVVYRL